MPVNVKKKTPALKPAITLAMEFGEDAHVEALEAAKDILMIARDHGVVIDFNLYLPECNLTEYNVDGK